MVVARLKSTIIPVHSLEEVNEKLQSEVKRRLSTCRIKIDTVSLCSSEDSRYILEPKRNEGKSLVINKTFLFIV
ncbi:hypothetical protein FOA24_20065 [Bacillus thuringiensis]